MTTPKPTIATDEQLHELANAVALQANALADLDPSAVEYYSKVRLIANNIDTLKAWTADRAPHPETANRRAAIDAVAAVEAREASDKTLGEMTAEERAAAIKRAAQRMSKELQENAQAISEILEDEDAPEVRDMNTQTVYVFEVLGATFAFQDPDAAAAARDREIKDGATGVSGVTKAEAPAHLWGDALADWCASNVDNHVPEALEE